MKLLTYRTREQASFGLLTDQGVVDLRSSLGGRVEDLRALLGDPDSLAQIESFRTADMIPFDQIEFLPVIPNPDKIFCVGLNYRTHVEETGRTESEKPVIFLRLASSQVGHGQAMLRPRVSTQFDYEGELAVIIGKPGRYIPREHAMEHVAGYACYNDGSVRDWQRHTGQWTPGKNFPATGSFGPWMVTADEIGDPRSLTLTTRLNGQIVQQTSVDLLIFSIPEIIEYVSAWAELTPGVVIVSGTPGGVGFKRNPPLLMNGGDTVEVEISRIGVLRNPIEDEVA
jgi:2-keto-4-pentenoate hydratase/2-oxohepta-3-ene-1,7-dioic acid hydratase in catechol pathway